MKHDITHNDLDIRIRRAHSIEYRRERIKQSLDSPPSTDAIISAEHELDNVGLGALSPTDDVVSRNVVCLPAGVTFMVGIKGCWPRAFALEVAHGPDEIDIAC